VSFRVSVDSSTLQDTIAYFEFVGGNASDAVRVAINKAGPPIRTKASSEIRSQVRLKAGYVRDRLKLIKATRNRLEGRIQTPSRGLLLSRYSTNAVIANDKGMMIRAPKVPPRGIKVKVKPTGSVKTMGKEWFYMKLRGSNRIGIVKRRTDTDRIDRRFKATTLQKGKYDVAYGPSLSQVFTDVKDDVLPEAQRRYEAELKDAVRFLLKKQKPG